jgi:hypothetical protein
MKPIARKSSSGKYIKTTLILAVLVSVLGMCGCFSLLQAVKQNETVRKDQLYILTRIRTEFEIAVYKSRMQESKNLQVLFSKNSKFPDAGMIFSNFGFLAASFGEYFILRIPEKYKYIKAIRLNLRNGEYANAFMNLTINNSDSADASESRQFLYIGDIVFYIEDDKVRVRAEDRSSDIDNGFMHYLKDSKGQYLKPQTVLFSPEEKAKFGIYKEHTFYRTQFMANGTTSLVPYTVIQTILEL